VVMSVHLSIFSDKIYLLFTFNKMTIEKIPKMVCVIFLIWLS
jgi:hypothetical protein